MESSRLDLMNDMAEHRPILKNNQNTYHHRFGFNKKQVALSITGFVFTAKFPVFWYRCKQKSNSLVSPVEG